MPRNIFGDPYSRLAEIENKIKLLNQQFTNNVITNINLQIDALISKNLDQDLTIANIENEILIIENNINSINSQIASIITKNNNQDSSINNINNNINSINSEIDSIITKNNNQDASINNIENNINSINTQIASIITKNNNQDTSINNINTQITSIELKNTDQDTSINNINTQIASIELKNTNQDTSINNINTQITSINNFNSLSTVEIVNPLRDSAGNIFVLDSNKSYSIKDGNTYHISYNCRYTSIGSAVASNTVRLLLPSGVTSNQLMYSTGNMTLTGMTNNYRIRCNPNSTFCTIIDQTGVNITVSEIGSATKYLIANIIIL
jgi:hypothetical protein